MAPNPSTAIPTASAPLTFTTQPPTTNDNSSNTDHPVFPDAQDGTSFPFRFHPGYIQYHAVYHTGTPPPPTPEHIRLQILFVSNLQHVVAYTQELGMDDYLARMHNTLHLRPPMVAKPLHDAIFTFTSE